MKKKLIGQCKICLHDNIELSEDHVPPKSVQPFLNLKAFNPFSHNIKTVIPNTYYSQNGLKFPTICVSCNTNLQKYDASLRYLVYEIKKYINSRLFLPMHIQITTRPNAIIRCILGHLLSSKTEVDSSAEDQKFRECVRNPDIPIPSNVYIYYWLYRYDTMKVFRDYVMPRRRGYFSGPPGVFHAIKFFPISFLVTDFEGYEALYSLNKFRNIPFTSEESITFKLDQNYPEHWPETVGNDNFLLLGNSMFDSKSAVKKEERA